MNASEYTALENIAKMREFVDGAFFAAFPLYPQGPSVVSAHVLEDLFERITLIESQLREESHDK